MDRRNFFKKSVVVAGAAGAVNFFPVSKAFAADSGLEFSASISRNHGHELTLTPGQLVELIRLTSAEDADLDITGGANHSHSVSLSQEDLLTVLIEGEHVVSSSAGGGHSHSVTLELLVDETF